MSDQYNHDAYPPTPATVPVTVVPPAILDSETTNTWTTTRDTPASSTGTSSGSASDTVKEQAAHLAGDTADATKNVAGTVKDQATNVAAEARTQAKDLYAQTKSELAEQAALQQERVADGLHSMSDELRSMAANSAEGGIATDLVHQASQRVEGIASWLETRDPGSLLGELKSYASRKPGTFIAVAAAAGILAGRLTRSVTSTASDNAGVSGTGSMASPTDPASATPSDEFTYRESSSPLSGRNGTADSFGSAPLNTVPVESTRVASDIGIFPTEDDFADRNPDSSARHSESEL